MELKKYFGFFILILLPNLLRQIIYKTTNYFTGSVGFIISFETAKLYSTNLWFLAFLEEAVIGLVFAFLWFKVKPLRFLSYGWISDAFLDYCVTLFWLIVGKTPFQLLNLNPLIDFILREIFFPYLVLGMLLYHLKVSIRKLVLAYLIFGVLILSLIIKFGGANLINVI